MNAASPYLFVIAAAVASLVGCGAGPGAPATSDGGASTAEAGHDAHPTEGPHGGSLIELGAEEYHAELVHDDDAGTVTVYLLDSAAKQAVPIAAADITVNLTHDGAAEQFKLTASPADGDPEGESSRFVSDEAELAEELDHAHGSAQLVVEINGTQYRGAVAHAHDH